MPNFEQVSIKQDDDLISLQQNERQELCADFEALKGKGQKSLCRGSVLNTIMQVKHETAD